MLVFFSKCYHVAYFTRFLCEYFPGKLVGPGLFDRKWKRSINATRGLKYNLGLQLHP